MKPIKIRSFVRSLRYLAVILAIGPLLAAAPGLSGSLIAQNQGAVSERRQNAQIEIFVASNGWHSAIFVASDAIPKGVIPEAADFPNAAFLGFGWGDADYFPARDPGLLTLLSAALQPTPSVIHVTGLSSHPRAAFPEDEVIGLTVSAEGFRDLLAFLTAVFVREGGGRAEMVAPGLHKFSKFYPARGKFHLFNNCNSWTARALAAAGLPMDDTVVLRAEELMAQLRPMVR